MAKWFGVNFPFYKGSTLLGSSEKVAGRQEDNRLIKNDLLQGLLTIKGERLFRPTFGGDIDRYLFEQNDVSSMSDLQESLKSQIEIFHPRIILSKIDIKESSSSPNVMIVNIYGRTDLDNASVNSLLVTFQVPVPGTIGGLTRGPSNGR